MELNVMFDIIHGLALRPRIGSSSPSVTLVTLEMMGRLVGWKRVDWIRSETTK